MSVIIIGMDVPKSCDACRLSYADVCPPKDCTVHRNVINRTKLNDCPFKSIDGLIKKIVNSPSDVGQDMYKTKYDGAVRRQNEIIEIIKEYCEDKK